MYKLIGGLFFNLFSTLWVFLLYNKIKFKEKDESKEDSLKDNYYQKNDTQIRELKSNNFEKDNIHKNEEKDEKKPKKKKKRRKA